MARERHRLIQDPSVCLSQIHVLEKLRIFAWKQASANAAETRDQTRVLDGNVSSATKGVKFAVSDASF